MKMVHKKRVVDVKVKKLSYIGKIVGLMFKSRRTENLLFEFKTRFISIHSFFVFFPFLAIWLDDKNIVREVRIVYPFTLEVKPEKFYPKLVEIPFNKGNEEIIRFFVGKEKDLNRI